MAWLVFIDTNIMLDFYRMPGESVERQLQSLENHLGSIIVTEQVKMEYLKHRQAVIAEHMGRLPKPNKHRLPMIVAGSQSAKMMEKAIDSALNKHKAVQKKIERILRDPTHHDPVYQSLNRIFAADSPFNLKRPDKERFTIRAAARKRFALGYPPRKAADTSIGDAINWEWIIRCAKTSADNPDVLIVSRDSDYGITFGDEPILNDWLRAEFKARVSRKRKIELTNKLSTALKKLDEHVPPEDEQAEQQVLNADAQALYDRLRPEVRERLRATLASYDRAFAAWAQQSKSEGEAGDLNAE